MLAKIDWQGIRPNTDVIADYNGFPWWHGLLVQPNRECWSADWLKQVGVFVYLPTYSRKDRRRGQPSVRRLCAALPGLMFVPQEMMDIDRRDDVFKFARVSGYIRDCHGYPKLISKADISLIQLMEAKLNLPPEAKGVLFKRGQRICFPDGSLWQSWGEGVIVEIASEHRIGIEINGLFGRTTKIYVAASEIEAL